MKAIMYHYVSPKVDEFPNLNRLDLDSFIKQLDYFNDKYGFISQNDFLESITKGRKNDGIILTFDDGLLCHYQYVFHELKKRNLWGIFYIPTSPFIKNKILDVHRIHILLSKISARSIYSYLIKSNIDNLFDNNKIEEFKELTYLTQKNDEYTLSVKRILNYFLLYQHRENVIDKLFKMFINSEYTINDYYLNIDNLKEMSSNGMVIGSHTENHMVMSKLSNEAQKNEIISSFNFLEKKLGNLSIKTFCYPYGGFHTFNKKTEQILEDYGCVFSFNVEQRDISLDDLKNRKQALPRYDCNQFLYGKSTND